jgi:hypothetical protein
MDIGDHRKHRLSRRSEVTTILLLTYLLNVFSQGTSRASGKKTALCCSIDRTACATPFMRHGRDMVPLLPLVHTFVAYWSLLLDVLRVTMLLIGDPIGFRLLSSDCDP